MNVIFWGEISDFQKKTKKENKKAIPNRPNVIINCVIQHKIYYIFNQIDHPSNKKKIYYTCSSYAYGYTWYTLSSFFPSYCRSGWPSKSIHIFRYLYIFYMSIITYIINMLSDPSMILIEPMVLCSFYDLNLHNNTKSYMRFFSRERARPFAYMLPSIFHFFVVNHKQIHQNVMHMFVVVVVTTDIVNYLLLSSK